MKASIALYQALKSIDISDERASAVVDALENDMATLLATKADIKALELATRADIQALERATKADIKALEQSTKADIKALEQSTKTDIKALELATRADIAQLESKLTIRMGVLIGSIVSLGVGIMLTAMRFMLPH